MTHVILTAIGSDRPGLVDEVSRFIFDRGGNIADSRMVNLRGQFAMMVLVGGDAEIVNRLRADVAGFGAKVGLHAEVRPADEAGAPKPAAAADAQPFRLVGTGIDRPGLVHRVAHLLREMNVNIESLESRLTAAPYTGAPLFEMELILAVPRSTPLSQLRQRLAAVCDELNVDWQLEAMG
jgi:glycine cleavage system transcriptional repressor